MADRTKGLVASTLAAFLAAYAGLGIVMIRVPGDMSGLQRVGLWMLLCSAFSALAFLKMKNWD